MSAPDLRHLVHLHLVDSAGTGDTRYGMLPVGVWEFESVGIVANATSTGHASNFADINVFGSDGSTLAYNRDTDSASDDTITAGASEFITAESGLAAATRFTSTAAAPAEVKVTTVHAASGVALDVELAIIFKKVLAAS